MALQTRTVRMYADPTTTAAVGRYWKGCVALKMAGRVVGRVYHAFDRDLGLTDVPYPLESAYSADPGPCLRLVA